MRKTWKKLVAMAVTASMVICGGAMGVSAATEEEPEKVTVHVAYMPDYASLNVLSLQLNLDILMMRILMYSLQSSPMDRQSFRLWNLDLLMLDTSDREPTNFAINGKADIFALAHVSNGECCNRK